jgi:SAM-dependent methyltransferase
VIDRGQQAVAADGARDRGAPPLMLGVDSSPMPAVDYEQLARFYDALVTDQSDLPYFRDLARHANGPVAEFMAGSGRLSVPIAGEGLDLTCVDSSEEMLALLREKLAARGARARLVCGDVTRVELGTQFMLIFIAFHSFEELGSDDERHACLENVRRHLQAGGRFVCTTHDVPTRLASVGPGRSGRWRFTDPQSERELMLSLETEYDDKTGVVEGEEALAFANEDVPFLRLPLKFRLIRPDVFARLADEAGLIVESVRADFTTTEYKEGQCRTAVWTLCHR